MATLTIQEKKEGNLLVLQIQGEIDAKTAPDLKLKLESSIGNGATKIVCDFSGVSYIASAGIGVLNSILKFLKEKSGELVFSNIKKEVRDTMDLMYFTKKIRIFESVKDALAAF
ncbi:anti-sigma factor antagonist [Leptospira yasudae]|uniref:Anti-sigma factor antagonist n=1 Tax=Leptospira yasudae TaxID=2202201 RepID=A0ABX9M6U0_9LEPT|nr:STAS domain-containing protein [Leptospira yasudae]RHX81336.1 anti-sigma factor antagonist [Leptospira yasudae]RHX96122.1 anti-sigma factor antagonist [Leptospira yasudae]TGK29939.1 anti-sigma factor antagonist [Leptospira yasudae]TGM07435.1 anti-sigma factor antagonist [Leptospira yasudae]